MPSSRMANVTNNNTNNNETTMATVLILKIESIDFSTISKT